MNGENLPSVSSVLEFKLLSSFTYARRKCRRHHFRFRSIILKGCIDFIQIMQNFISL